MSSASVRLRGGGPPLDGDAERRKTDAAPWDVVEVMPWNFLVGIYLDISYVPGNSNSLDLCDAARSRLSSRSPSLLCGVVKIRCSLKGPSLRYIDLCNEELCKDNSN